MDSEVYEGDEDEVLGVLTGQVPVRSMPIAMKADEPDEDQTDESS